MIASMGKTAGDENIHLFSSSAYDKETLLYVFFPKRKGNFYLSFIQPVCMGAYRFTHLSTKNPRSVKLSEVQNQLPHFCQIYFPDR
jgi:hypothetical protein